MAGLAILAVILAAVVLPALAITIAVCAELRRPNVTIYYTDQSDRRSVTIYTAPTAAPMLPARESWPILESGAWQYDNSTIWQPPAALLRESNRPERRA